MSGRVEGRVAVVTGGAGFFGRAIARRLLDEGGRVAIWDVDEERLTRSTNELRALPGKMFATKVDVGRWDDVCRATEESERCLGGIDILVNNAAVAKPSLAWEITREHWDLHLQINLTGAFCCAQMIMTGMMERRRGRIINIASLAAQQGRPYTSPAYAASKGGLLGLTVSLARHLAEYGITVNAINPGIFTHEVHNAFTADQLHELTADIPLNRDGLPGARGEAIDIANSVLFLASDEATYITGAFLNVNGGSRTG